MIFIFIPLNRLDLIVFQLIRGNKICSEQDILNGKKDRQSNYYRAPAERGHTKLQKYNVSGQTKFMVTALNRSFLGLGSKTCKPCPLSRLLTFAKIQLIFRDISHAFYIYKLSLMEVVAKLCQTGFVIKKRLAKNKAMPIVLVSIDWPSYIVPTKTTHICNSVITLSDIINLIFYAGHVCHV